jgi:hypothetical protein
LEFGWEMSVGVVVTMLLCDISGGILEVGSVRFAIRFGGSR